MRAKTSPIALARYLTDGRYQWPPHIRFLNRKLLDVAHGRCPRLMIFMPPRHGKSELTSHYFPAWYLGRYPDRSVLLCSHEADFAASWGRKTRDTVREAKRRGVFAATVRRDVEAASHWELQGHSGGMATAGAGGAIMGKGADLLVIDDPTKNAEQAASPIHRETLWEWYNSTAYTRLEPGAAVILIHTRWHELDLGGRMLAEGKDEWEVISLPAIAQDDDPLGRDPGEALWPARYPVEAIEAIKRQIGTYWFSALYAQSPIPRDGNLLQREWFEIVDAAPARARRVRFWDLAASKDGDWTVGILLSCDQSGVYYIEDVRRLRGTALAAEKAVAQTAAIDGRRTPIAMEQEPGSSGVNTIDHYRRHVLKGFTFRGVPATGSKEHRADPWAAQAEAGNVKLVRGDWNADFLDEVHAFPHGAHDDQVDATSGAFAQLARRRQVRAARGDRPMASNVIDL